MTSLRIGEQRSPASDDDEQLMLPRQEIWRVRSRLTVCEKLVDSFGAMCVYPVNGKKKEKYESMRESWRAAKNEAGWGDEATTIVRVGYAEREKSLSVRGSGEQSRGSGASAVERKRRTEKERERER